MNSKLTLSFTAGLLCLVLLPQSARAGGQELAGKQKSASCAACHGADGKSIDPNYPNLAGQYESYLIKALSDYRSGKRTNVIMAGMATPLSNQDIEDLAAFYSSLEGNLSDLSGR